VYVNEEWPSCLDAEELTCEGDGQHASYNRHSGLCELGEGSECKGGENFFPDLTTCNATCKNAPKPPCSLEPDTGFGRAYHRHWYFNTEYAKCLQFIFGGGLGNANNFLSKDECKKKCHGT
ncbi:unnamed protein product, partial [Ixodes hexagonus]